MALAKHTIILISISAFLFSNISNAQSISAPSPAGEPRKMLLEFDSSELPLPDVSASSPAPATNEPAKKLLEYFHSIDFHFPDFTNIIHVQTKPGVANVVTKQMQMLETKIVEFNKGLKKRMANSTTSEKVKTCIKECDEHFLCAVKDIKTILASLESRNASKAKSHVSAVARDVDTCNVCFRNTVGKDEEVNKFDIWVMGITREALRKLS